MSVFPASLTHCFYCLFSSLTDKTDNTDHLERLKHCEKTERFGPKNTLVSIWAAMGWNALYSLHSLYAPFLGSWRTAGQGVQESGGLGDVVPFLWILSAWRWAPAVATPCMPLYTYHCPECEAQA